MSMFAMLKLCSRENNFQFSWCLKENLTDGYVVVLVTVVNEVVVSAALVVSVTAPCFGDVDDAYHYHVKIIIWLPGVLPVVLCSDVLDMAVVVVVAFVVGSSFTRFPQLYIFLLLCPKKCLHSKSHKKFSVSDFPKDLGIFRKEQ